MLFIAVIKCALINHRETNNSAGKGNKSENGKTSIIPTFQMLKANKQRLNHKNDIKVFYLVRKR